MRPSVRPARSHRRHLHTRISIPVLRLAMPALVHEPSASDFNLFDADHHLPPSPTLADAVAYALQKCPGFKFLPSNYDSLDSTLPRNGSSASAHFSCDAFRMYEFKVRRCMRGRSHDWTECPFAHPGEKARRRDPRRIHYSGSPCPDFRKGSCRRGDTCEFAHGVFECWLHPARYRTQECKDGKNCKRRVCFFAHSPEQLRVLPISSASSTQVQKAHGSAGGHSGEPMSVNKQFSENGPFPNSVGMQKTHQFSTSAAMLSLPSTPHPADQVIPLPMHPDLANLSALRRAAIQNALACKGYGVNLNAAEYYSVLDGYEGLNGEHTCVPHISTQQMHFAYCPDESLFAKFRLPPEKSSYELPSYSHGFTSPTSTLAGHVFSPPPLSPPLSPSTSPNSKGIRQSFIHPANDCHDSFVDDTVIYKNIGDEASMCSSLNYFGNLGSRLQNLHIAFRNDAGYAEQKPCREMPTGQLTSIMEQSRLSRFKNLVSNHSCTSKGPVWGHASEFAYSGSSALDVWQEKEVVTHNLGISKLGEESISDNFAPDFGWVSELVK